jgi:hypothetical protein
MGRIAIEYRYKASGKKEGRRDTLEMRHYLEGLVNEMRSAGIDAEYIDSAAYGGDINTVSVNGRDVVSILDGLEIRALDAEDCDPGMRPKIVMFERPATDWNRDEIEDIPDVLMKNAISKAYADMNRNGMI